MGNETFGSYRQLEFAPIQAKIKKLQSDRRYRDGNGLFYAEGIRNFVEAVDYNYVIDTIIYSEKLLTSPIARKLTRRLKRDGTPFARITPEQFRHISQTERSSGIAAIFKQEILNLDQLNLDSHICWIALENIRSLGNLGTLIRTSAATGSGGFIFIGEQIDPFDPSVVRATMGALFKQKIARATAEQFQKWVKSHQLQVVGATPDGSFDYDKICYTPPTVLLLGNERKGLTSDERRLCQKLVRIPMIEGTDSLNVAVAGSLLLYEVFRSSQQK